MNQLLLLIRETICGKILDLFFFVAPKEMRLVYAKHIYWASAEFRDKLKEEFEAK